MDLTFSTAPLATLDVDLLAIVVEDPAAPPPEITDLDTHLDGALTRELGRGRLKKARDSHAVVTGAATGPVRIMLVGISDKADTRRDALRIAGARIAESARLVEARTLALLGNRSGDEVEPVVSGITLGNFRIHKYRTDGVATSSESDDAAARYDGVESLVILGDEAGLSDRARHAHTLASAQNWARDLANAPANLLTPEQMSHAARDLAESHEHLSWRELDRAGIDGKGMGMFAAVAKGSGDEPRLIVLEWNPPAASESDAERLALVGKAVVFDTGGISLKPGSGMEEMKLDKSGGCAVLGAMRAIAETNVPHRVLAVVGATTNMPDAHAYRPGDVVTAMDGTTVEIISTDAEGRLVLGDCIAYAKELGCGAILEASTLTGAMVIALGHRYAGAVARRGALLDAVVAAGELTGDHAWHLPMHDEYSTNLSTACADLKNSGGRDAGALSAGSFLQHFAKDTPFVHLDIAGTAMLPKARLWYGCKGASGWGVRLLTHVAAEWDASTMAAGAPTKASTSSS